MDKFNLREYLKNNPLLKEEAPKFKGGNTFIEDNPYFEADEIPSTIDHFETSSIVQAINSSNTSEEFFKKLFPKEAGFSMAPSEDIKKFFSYHKSNLAENKILNELELNFYDEDDPNAVTLTAQSGEYDGDVEDGMVSFSVYDEYEEFDEDNWEDILGSNHAFSQISNKIPTKVEADGDYVQITVKIDDLKGIAK